MKDFLIGIAITAVLIVVFSEAVPFFPYGSAEGIYPTQAGESGMASPGGGEGFAELTSERSESVLREETERDLREAEDEAAGKAQSESTREKEQARNMNEIMIAFWHGVAAVLIGEACALALGLILAAAWLRRK